MLREVLWARSAAPLDRGAQRRTASTVSWLISRYTLGRRCNIGDRPGFGTPHQRTRHDPNACEVGFSVSSPPRAVGRQSAESPVFTELWINLAARGVQEIVTIQRAAMRLLPIVAIYCVPLFGHPPGPPTDSLEAAVYKSFVKQHTAWAGGCESAVLDSGALPIAEGFQPYMFSRERVKPPKELVALLSQRCQAQPPCICKRLESPFSRLSIIPLSKTCSLKKNARLEIYSNTSADG
jgi:hypothetical protein